MASPLKATPPTSTTTHSPTNWQLIRRMLVLAWQFRAGCIKVILLNIALQAMALTGLYSIGLGIDYVKWKVQADGTDPPKWPFGLQPDADAPYMVVLLLVAGAVLVIATVRATLTYVERVTAADLVNRQIVVSLRSKVYDKMQRLSFRFFDANATGTLINRVTGDVQAVRMFIEMVVVQTVILGISLIVYITYMVSIHPLLALACLATTPLLWGTVVRFSKVVKPAYLENRRLVDEAVLRLSENLSGVHVVKGFSLQQQQIDHFAESNRKVRDQKRWIFWQQSFYLPAIHMFTHINRMVLLGYGGYLFIQGELAMGTGLVVFAGILNQFSDQVQAVGGIANSMQQSLVGAQRVFEVLDEPMEITSPPNALRLPRAKGRIDFRDVTFGYESDDPVLQDISFTVEPGQCVAILGATGSGKSSLLSLIPRFYDPQQGQVLIDGHDVREYDLDDLRKNVGLVFQESFLFSNTVEQNIAFGHPDATQSQIEKAARIASAHEFVSAMDKGYKSILGERGAGLSGGQRQRLAIARAVLLEPPILLLDDPTAAIDPETEGEILEAMDQAMQGRTTFVVAHRLSTLRRADWVVVLDKGRIVQIGTHEQLMGTKGHYRWAANLQVGDEQSRRLLGFEGGQP
jgi:ATP-binding cassette subfamily B protein